MHIAIIVAVAENRVIGIGPSSLPWHLPKDMRYFKDTTMGHPMIMGRKTFEAFPKPLPNRLHIVISRSVKDYDNESVVGVTTIEDAIAIAKQTGTDRAFIIGGGEIFAQSLHLADELYLTEVAGKPVGDIFFPEWDKKAFEEVSRNAIPADDKHEYAFSFVIYQRIEG
jgi:dihydrofolate reductase